MQGRMQMKINSSGISAYDSPSWKEEKNLGFTVVLSWPVKIVWQQTTAILFVGNACFSTWKICRISFRPTHYNRDFSCKLFVLIGFQRATVPDFHESRRFGNQFGGSQPRRDLRRVVESVEWCPEYFQSVPLRTEEACIRLPLPSPGKDSPEFEKSQILERNVYFIWIALKIWKERFATSCVPVGCYLY